MISFILFSIIGFNAVAADRDIPVTRFDGPLLTLEYVLNKYDGSQDSLESIAQEMLRGPRRIAAFQLQALAQIYQKYPNGQSESFFKDSIRFEAKALEDALGGFDKWDSLLKSAKKKGSSAAKLQEAEEERDLAFQILVYVLSGQKSQALKDDKKLTKDSRKFLDKFEKGKKDSLFPKLYWVESQPTLSNAIRQELNNWPWLPPTADQEYVVKRLRKHLEDLDEINFNFKILEDTEDEKGLHEYRREVRWFSYQAGVLNGTVNFYDTFMGDSAPACPNPRLAELTDPQAYPDLASSKYSQLPETPFKDEKVCGISRCLYYKITHIVAEVGEIKDKVETGNFEKGAGNVTPDWAASAVQDIYDDMKDSKVIDLLRDELKACYQ